MSPAEIVAAIMADENPTVPYAQTYAVRDELLRQGLTYIPDGPREMSPHNSGFLCDKLWTIDHGPVTGIEIARFVPGMCCETVTWVSEDEAMSYFNGDQA